MEENISHFFSASFFVKINKTSSKLWQTIPIGELKKIIIYYFKNEKPYKIKLYQRWKRSCHEGWEEIEILWKII